MATKTTKKKQIGFYADQDVEKYLETVDPGIKTKTINNLLRAHLELQNRPRINYNCSHCMRATSGVVEFTYSNPRWVDDGSQDPPDEFVLVRCLHSECQSICVLEECEELPEFGPQYVRVYPEDERISGLESQTLRNNLQKAESAFYNHDYNAVALYCRRILEAFCGRFEILLDDSLRDTPLQKRLDVIQERGQLDNRLWKWAKMIADDTDLVIGNTDLDLDGKDAHYILLFTRELLKASLLLSKEESEYECIKQKRPKRRHITNLEN